ncbi:MAG: DNA translocase FtsK [Eubacterium sp.]|nr:DNA translocase FtsK [Candidatus Colimonas fimequi]
MVVGGLIVKYVGLAGLFIISFVVIFICLLLVLDTPVSRMFGKAKDKKAQMAASRAERIAEKERIAEERRQQLEVQMMLDEDRRVREAQEKAEKKRNFFNFGFSGGNTEPEPEPEPEPYYDPYEYLPPNQRKIMNYVEGNEGPVGFYEGGMYDDGYTPKEINTENPYEFSEGGFWNTGNDENIVVDETNSSKNKKKKAPIVVTGAKEPELDIFEPEEEGVLFKGEIDSTDAHGVQKKMSKTEAAKSMLKEAELNQATIVNYEFPPIDLLKVNKNRGKNGDSEGELMAKAQKLEDVLHSFNIDADVTNVTQGPTVTRYEVHPNSGVKVKGIKSLADDIALNMEAKSIRIEAPIPGKPAVGIEIENDKINMVTVRELIDSKPFKDAKSKITFAVGKDISGNEIVADLKSMPHLLIAGSTGSGKSVCINSIITSFIYKARPEEVKLVLVDPKVVELANYNGIPHLLIPVVTDPAKAAAALNWAVAEMDERYRKFADEGVRELASFNDHMRLEGRDEEVMPQIVIIIDELADLMIVAPSQVEDSIMRLAQKARAAGMHLIVATQRPSVDVITGVIKANIPSRIAFAVSSQVDSRTILDMAGAEKLVGKGDMLFNPLGKGKPVRVQGTFISDEEVNDVIDFVKAQASEEPEYAETVLDRIERANASVTPPTDEKNPDDELLADAIELVVQAQQASVSMLQRRFRIGYNRAARIVDMMEERQIVGPQDGSRPRAVLISEEEFNEMKHATEDMEE